jgi:release factor glutamine methyltransferase
MSTDRLQPLLDWAIQELRRGDFESPQLDARLLLQRATGCSREDMILEPEREVAPAIADHFRRLVTRRLAHEPVSRILGEREFYGRTFKVTPDVLDPRPDTETLVDLALPLMGPSSRILDLGTGSGAIIITLLAEWPDATGVATDFSAAALAVAAANAEALGVADRLSFVQGSWFGAVSGRFDLIVSNPPYIPSADIAGLEPDVRAYDPHLALAGGSDGLDPYRVIAAKAANHLMPGGCAVVEQGAGQADDVTAIFAAAGFHLVRQGIDLGGHIRCLVFSGSPKPVVCGHGDEKTIGKSPSVG